MRNRQHATERYLRTSIVPVKSSRTPGISHRPLVAAFCIVMAVEVGQDKVLGQPRFRPKLALGQLEELITHQVPDSTLHKVIQTRGRCPSDSRKGSVGENNGRRYFPSRPRKNRILVQECRRFRQVDWERVSDKADDIGGLN